MLPVRQIENLLSKAKEANGIKQKNALSGELESVYRNGLEQALANSNNATYSVTKVKANAET